MIDQSSIDVLVLESLSVRQRGSECEMVSLSIPEGSIHGLVGGAGAGKAAIVACVIGRRKPSAGHAFLAGQDIWRNRRSLWRWIQAITPETRIGPSLTLDRLAKRRRRSAAAWDEQSLRERLARLGVPVDTPLGLLTPFQRTAALLGLALAAAPRLVVLHDVDLGPTAQDRRGLLRELQSAASRGVSALIATRRPEEIEEVVDRLSVLRAGSLILSGDVAGLRSRFRRIRDRNEIVEARTEYGNELDQFEAVRVRVRGWGVEAVISNFDEALFAEFRRTPGVIDVEESRMSLAEIYEAVAGRSKKEA
jgi:ABC-type multidrug transport system ATPase subunit